MKKLVALALAGTLLFSAVGCSGNSKKDSKSKKHSKNQAEEVEDDDEDEDDEEKEDKKDKGDKKDKNHDLDAMDDLGDSSKPNELKKNSKQQEFYSDDSHKDALGFILPPDYSYDEYMIFVGIKGQGVTDDFTINSYDISNDAVRVSDCDDGDLTFGFGEEYILIETENYGYKTSDGKTIEYLENQEVIYQEGNYYITGTNIEKYVLLYKLHENPWDDYNGESSGTWDCILFNYYDTVEEAKEKLDLYKDMLYIETCTVDESFAFCKSSGYTMFNDILVKTLNDFGLYVDSASEVSFDSCIYVNKDNYSFDIEFDEGTDDSLEGKQFSLNGLDAYVDGNYVMYNYNGYTIEIYVDLPYDIDDTEDNIIAAVNEVFS